MITLALMCNNCKYLQAYIILHLNRLTIPLPESLMDELFQEVFARKIVFHLAAELVLTHSKVVLVS